MSDFFFFLEDSTFHTQHPNCLCFFLVVEKKKEPVTQKG